MRHRGTALLIAFALVSPAVYAGESVISPSTPPNTSIRASIEKVQFDAPARAQLRTASQTNSHHSVATKASAGVAMGILGMLGGGIAGYWTTMACGCEQPFYVGVYGGAIGGAITGVWLASR